MVVPVIRHSVWLLGLLAGLAGAAAQATPYWINYEADDYPENLGWWRIWYAAPAQRTLLDGFLIMDTMADTAIAEGYEQRPSFPMDPGPGETFLLQWRVRVDEILRGREPGITLASDEHRTISYTLNMNSVSNDDGQTAYFTPGLFHEFELRTTDMRSYELYVDGSIGCAGEFWQSGMPARVVWGAMVQGEASVATWDYVRFGVVPEPASAVLALVVVFCRPRIPAKRNGDYHVSHARVCRIDDPGVGLAGARARNQKPDL